MKITYLILLFSFTLSAQVTDELYPQQVGDIEFDQKLDDPNFKICDVKQTAQYYNFSKGFQYKGEKYEILKKFKENYNPKIVTTGGGSGYITIRFLINCEGKKGLFRVQEMDMNYMPTKFDEDNIKQLLAITKSLDGWLIGEYDEKKYDYYQYLTFKLINYKLLEILP